MDSIPYPSSLADVANLITALYAPGPTERIKHIQEVLQQVQRSAEGWRVAQGLLCSDDENLKFFGALTVVIKLNTESMADEDATKLVENLVAWLLKAVEDGEKGLDKGDMVMLKICSALSTFFLHYSRLWKHSIRHLVQSFDTSTNIPLQDFDGALPVWMAANRLSWKKLQAVICFASELADDVFRMDPNSSKHADLRSLVLENAKDSVELLFIGMDYQRHGENAEMLGDDSIRCFHSWLIYAVSLSDTSNALRGLLRPLIDQLIHVLDVDIMYEKSTEMLTEILDNYPGFLSEDHYRKLAASLRSEQFQSQYSELTQGDFDYDNELFGWLMIAYGNARVEKLTESTDNESQLFLNGMVGLTGCQGYVAEEDDIFATALEFWSTFVETMTDESFSSEGERQPWFDTAMAHVKQVLSNSWRKIQFPPPQEFMEWDSNNRVKFMDARKDVADLLEAVFALTGPPLISMFVDLLLQHLGSSNWAEIEASAFCLCSLADCIPDDGKCDDLMSRVFSAPFFNLVLESQTQMPTRLRHTVLQLIERYADYFERRPEFLPAALNLLFGGLGDSALGGDSAKCIAKLCSSCRHILTAELPAFLGQYGAIYQGSPMDSLAEEKVVLAIACIIQAVNDEGAKLSAFAQLFDFARQDVERSIQLAANPQILNLEDPLYRRGIDATQVGDSQGAVLSPGEISLQLALRALRCISSMAKGMQSTREATVDLDAPAPQGQMSNELVAIQNGILNMLSQLLLAFPTSNEVMEVICNIFRAGFSESEPGPFVFSPVTVSSFFTSLTINSPRIGSVVQTACSFLSSLFKGPPDLLIPTLSQLLPWVISLLQSLPTPEADTELTQHSIDLIRRLMAKSPQVLFYLQPSSLIELFFLFTLQVLNGAEPLPKAAAAEFWTEFLALKSEDPATQASISGAMEHLGPLIARSLMRNIGGEAMRSELDKLAEPLKKLVVQHVRAQQWLEGALVADDFPSDKVSLDEKRAFLKKVVNLRGSRQTNLVVREFWVACRGSSFAYAS